MNLQELVVQSNEGSMGPSKVTLKSGRTTAPVHNHRNELQYVKQLLCQIEKKLQQFLLDLLMSATFAKLSGVAH